MILSRGWAIPRSRGSTPQEDDDAPCQRYHLVDAPDKSRDQVRRIDPALALRGGRPFGRLSPSPSCADGTAGKINAETVELSAKGPASPDELRADGHALQGGGET